MILDHLSRQLTHFYVIDKERLSIYHVNIAEFLNCSFRNMLTINMQELATDSEEIHENVMKTLIYRVKKLKTL